MIGSNKLEYPLLSVVLLVFSKGVTNYNVTTNISDTIKCQLSRYTNDVTTDQVSVPQLSPHPGQAGDAVCVSGNQPVPQPRLPLVRLVKLKRSLCKNTSG